ncbi:hypothetical protein OSTOST_12001, partial [Ostertagia ostertagi]
MKYFNYVIYVLIRYRRRTKEAILSVEVFFSALWHTHVVVLPLHEFRFTFCYAGLFGFSISSYICLTSVILVDLLGLDKLTNAFGLLLLWQGVGTVFGPPISGYLADITHSYVWSFVFCGANLLVSCSLLQLPIV